MKREETYKVGEIVTMVKVTASVVKDLTHPVLPGRHIGVKVNMVDGSHQAQICIVSGTVESAKARAKKINNMEQPAKAALINIGGVWVPNSSVKCL